MKFSSSSLIAALAAMAVLFFVAPVHAESSHADLARSLNKAFGDVYEKVAPSVVVIEARRAPAVVTPSSQQMLQYFFQTPRGNALPGNQGFRPPPNQGSGFILTKDGYILTNNHVLEDADPAAIEVTLHDGRKFPAVLVGNDAPSDLAVLKIETDDLTAAEIGNSEVARVGEFAFALGSPFDLRDTFTFGVIGAKGRTDVIGGPDYEEYIQTDAAINPGNSGGPLVNIDGRVIGVNTLINGINRGLGFAIPINLATRVAQQLIENGRFMRPWLGIGIIGVAETEALARTFPGIPREEIERVFGQFTAGVVVSGFDPTAPETTRRNLKPGDVILKVDGQSVTTSRDLQRIILEASVGQSLELEVWRNGKLIALAIPTTERSDGIIRAALTPSSPAPAPATPATPDALPPSTLPSAPSPMPESSTAPAGLEVRELTEELAQSMGIQPETGVLVTAVEAGSPAEMAQIFPGDVVTSVGSRPIRTVEDLVSSLSKIGANGTMLHLNRGDRRTFAILKP